MAEVLDGLDSLETDLPLEDLPDAPGAGTPRRRGRGQNLVIQPPLITFEGDRGDGRGYILEMDVEAVQRRGRRRSSATDRDGRRCGPDQDSEESSPTRRHAAAPSPSAGGLALGAFGALALELLALDQDRLRLLLDPRRDDGGDERLAIGQDVDEVTVEIEVLDVDGHVQADEDETSTSTSCGMSFGSALTWMLDRLWSRVPPVSSTAGASPTKTSGTSTSISTLRLTRK